MAKARLFAVVFCILGILIFTGCNAESDPDPEMEDNMDSETKQADNTGFYSFTMNDIDGNPVELSKYKGKVLLLVNVASKCGFTKQYEGLQKLYEKYQDKDFVVLGFPANNFLFQEPGTNEEIKQFCTSKFNVTFDMFAKISVKGKNIHPLYAYLTGKDTNPGFDGDITWNFNKFLIDRNGKCVGRYGSKIEPMHGSLLADIENSL